MKIGYPCVNRGIGCTANSTFRLASYTEENMRQKISNNLSCLLKILKYNVKNNIYFFRISSDIIPFASHPVCGFDWAESFAGGLREAGNFIKRHGIRISMHPDQFTILNSDKDAVLRNSIAEINYHCRLLDAMKLGAGAKVQIHVGGVYGDRGGSIKRFVSNYRNLDGKIKKRLVVENDDRHYSVRDCLSISGETGVPVLLDVFHHECFNRGESLREAFSLASQTWKEKDGIPMVDYSIQKKEKRKGAHAEMINMIKFKAFFREVEGFDFDLMLEIKDKEISALKAVKWLEETSSGFSGKRALSKFRKRPLHV